MSLNDVISIQIGHFSRWFYPNFMLWIFR